MKRASLRSGLLVQSQWTVAIQGRTRREALGVPGSLRFQPTVQMARANITSGRALRPEHGPQFGLLFTTRDPVQIWLKQPTAALRRLPQPLKGG
jgi:hypothetical protein